MHDVHIVRAQRLEGEVDALADVVVGVRAGHPGGDFCADGEALAGGGVQGPQQGFRRSRGADRVGAGGVEGDYVVAFEEGEDVGGSLGGVEFRLRRPGAEGGGAEDDGGVGPRDVLREGSHSEKMGIEGWSGRYLRGGEG